MQPPRSTPHACARGLTLCSLWALLLLPSALSWTQGREPMVRSLTAVPTLGPIRIDGRLTETTWQRAGIRGFIQREPDEGKASTFETEVWVSFDDDALYIGARMRDSAPDSIVSRLVRRDTDFESDWFYVFLDSKKREINYSSAGHNPMILMETESGRMCS